MPNPIPDAVILETVFKAGLVAHVIGTLILLALTQKALRQAVQRDSSFTRTPPQATVPVMIPVGNVTPMTEPALRSLLEQDHPDYRVMLITGTSDEPASTLIQKLCTEYEHASHIVAGKADRCAQKNHNLLAAIPRLEPREDILVFCDSTHLAKPDFLARLVEPIVSNKALLASGYRFVRPGDARIGTLVQMLAVQTLHMLWSITAISQPWGGATAIKRVTFFDNNIPDLWSRTVVDDYSMGPYLQSLGIRSLPVVEACLETHLGNQSVADATNWFYRQLQFFKFYTPWTWVAASIIPIFYLSILAYALISIPTSAPYFFAVALTSLWYTTRIPSTASAPRRIAAYFLFTIIAALQLLRTWTSNILDWQGITYKVRLGGEILDIKRSERTDV